jgi:hypothetical protein
MLCTTFENVKFFDNYFTTKEFDNFEYSEINSIILTQLHKHKEFFTLCIIEVISR